MISGASDNNVMIWTSPFDGYQGEVIEGIDVSLPKEQRKKNSPTRDAGASFQNNQDDFGSRGNQSMNIEVEDR